MAIKHIVSPALTRHDFNDAMTYLRLRLGSVAQELSIPRAYLSEFRHGMRNLVPEHLAALRVYFESKGVEFVAEPSDESIVAPTGWQCTGYTHGCFCPTCSQRDIDRAEALKKARSPLQERSHGR